ncbi:MAG: hypothetical protein EYC70_02935 [Planctomycetota bacterium]|nr:MAG: hypothetical protein EYC70_02935 [Planctomycetota bacterium]
MSLVRQPSLWRALGRGLCCRCPLCGKGRVFPRGFRPQRCCAACGWRYERGSGYFLGGNEINLVATFPVGVGAYLVAQSVLGDGVLAPLVGGLAAGLFALAFARPARALFYALDCWADPLRPDDDDHGSSRDWTGRRTDPFPVGSVCLRLPPELNLEPRSWPQQWPGTPSPRRGSGRTSAGPGPGPGASGW